MPSDNAIDDGQTNPAAFEFCRTVEALENAEQLLLILLVETNSVIPNVYHDLFMVAVRADLDEGLSSRTSIFDSVIKQIM